MKALLKNKEADALRARTDTAKLKMDAILKKWDEQYPDSDSNIDLDENGQPIPKVPKKNGKIPPCDSNE